MPDPAADALDYLAPAPNSFWHWEDWGRVAAWSSGGTIAFREEIIDVLVRLAPHGLPEFDAVVVLLAACRQSWRESSGGLTTAVGLMASLEHRAIPPWLPELMSELDRVNAMMVGLPGKPQCQLLLAETVFENVRERCPGIDGETVCELLRSVTEYDFNNLAARRSGSFDPLTRSLRRLYDGLRKIDRDSLLLRLRTGMDQLVGPADIPLDPAQRARQLIARLRDDPELAGLAGVARQLMAAIHFPRSVSDREELPVGGVSDISNRGPLDRLLLSELAQDELTLAVRVAMNEALYLRREAPPRNPPQHRAVLVDCGLRLWGVPRVFAAAVGLALTASALPNLDVAAFRPSGKKVEPVDLTRREGLVAHLAALDAAAHPGQCFPALLETVQAGEGGELVLVTSEDTLHDPDFRRCLGELNGLKLYVATVRRDGRFQLLALERHGHKRLAEARLNLDELLAPRARPTTPPLDARMAGGLPAIFRTDPFPLLLPSEIDRSRAWPVLASQPGEAAGLMSITADGRLLHWARPNFGPRQLAQNVRVAGTVRWQGVLQNAVIPAVVGTNHAMSLVSCDIAGGTFDSVKLEIDPKPRGFGRHNDVLFAYYSVGVVDVLDMATGRRLKTLRTPARQRFCGRYFLSRGGSWHALNYDGLSARADELLAISPKAPLKLIELFDQVGVEGAVGVTVQGDLYFTATRRQERLLPRIGQPWHIHAIAADGRELLVSDARQKFHRVDLVSRQVQPALVRPNQAGQFFLDAAIAKSASPRSLRKKFRAIGVSRDGDLMLVGAKRKFFRITERRLLLALVPATADECRSETLRDFEEGPRLPSGISLQAAAWDDGSRAWLDPRGLLHLRSAWPSLPEVTLVLNESHLAGWSSSGKVFGAEYFTGYQRATNDFVYASGSRRELEAVVYRYLLKPIAERLQ